MTNPEPDAIDRDLIEGLLRELAGHLHALAEHDLTGAIDLRSLPLTDVQLDGLRERLGRGEVSASFDVAGRSEVWETRYPGIWWIRHYDGLETVVVERIEITAVPEILRAGHADLAAAAANLRRELAVVEQDYRAEVGSHGGI
ncbi:MAG: hydrogenase expression/formation protein [Gammaproteobacteria bacterium]|nr:hydrogenase expression/formation protein [Gammaproteobacteria bacterium]